MQYYQNNLTKHKSLLLFLILCKDKGLKFIILCHFLSVYSKFPQVPIKRPTRALQINLPHCECIHFLTPYPKFVKLR